MRHCVLSVKELANLVTFATGRYYSGIDSEETMEIAIGWLDKHESGPGWYAWSAEYPEEGSIPIHFKETADRSDMNEENKDG